MGVFSLFHLSNGITMDEGVKEAKSANGAVLLDVRTREEYAQGHVPGSVNLPLDELDTIGYAKSTPLFVYCRSGARSGRGVEFLKKAGYEQAVNIGGIMDYHGEIE
ncbi:MAG: rhodanese-like domain-containing protein [Lachnospiraceae bacterium]